MKQDIENIIKKNLPEKIEEIAYQVKHKSCCSILDHQPTWCGDCFACSECGIKYIPASWINQTISQIPVSLIADEVLKVVVEKIESYKKIELLKLRGCKNDKINWNYHQGKVHQLEDLLSNLSTNKENKNNERNV